MAQRSSSEATRMVFLLHGEDPFRTRLRVGELVAALLAGDAVGPSNLAVRMPSSLSGSLGVTRLDARVDSASDIGLAGRSRGLFAAEEERRVVVVEHAEVLRDHGFLAAFPPEAALVLVSLEPLRTSRARGRARAKPSAPPATLPDAVLALGGTAERVARLEPLDVPRWIEARAKLRGVVLRPEAVGELASAVGPDTERIEQELVKLGAFAGQAPVTAADVKSLVSGAIEADVFELTKAVVRGSARDAMPVLERLLAEGQVVQQILALLLWQFRVLLFASRAPSTQEAERMAKAIRSSPGAILRYTQFARGVTRAEIARAYESLYATDQVIKTGRAESDAAALTLCVLDLCGVSGADLRDMLLVEPPRR